VPAGQWLLILSDHGLVESRVAGVCVRVDLVDLLASGKRGLHEVSRMLIQWPAPSGVGARATGAMWPWEPPLASSGRRVGRLAPRADLSGASTQAGRRRGDHHSHLRWWPALF